MSRNLKLVEDMIIRALHEGAEDQKYRQQADAAADVAIKALRSGRIKPRFEDSQGTESHRAIFDLNSVPGLEGIELAFGISDEGQSGGLYSDTKKRARISLNAIDSNGKFTGDPAKVKRWKALISKNAAKVLEKYRTTFVHEFIHHLDKQRVDTKAWNQVAMKAKGGDKEYFNNPLELNAFSQMGMSDFAQKIKNVKTKDGVLMLMGGSPQEFWKRLQKHMNPTFMAHLSEPNRRKLQKRSYQLWQDILAKFERGNS